MMREVAIVMIHLLFFNRQAAKKRNRSTEGIGHLWSPMIFFHCEIDFLYDFDWTGLLERFGEI